MESNEQVQLIATRRFCYAKQDVGPGDLFYATPEHAHLLIVVGSATPVEAHLVSAEVPTKKYKRRDMRVTEK